MASISLKKTLRAALALALFAAPVCADENASATSTKIIPLPIYSTLPNEGSTWGFMPVFLTVEDKSQRTSSIIAPSVSWNKIIRYTSTFRLYYYPDDNTTINFIPSISSNINRGLTLEYFSLPRGAGKMTNEADLRTHRSLFARFFGIGPQTKGGSESSYTRITAGVGWRGGFNLDSHLNLGLRLALKRDLTEHHHVDFLPLAHDAFPGTAGFGGATALYQGLSLRYDNRANRQYSTRGFAAEVSAGVNEGLAGAPVFGTLQFEAKKMWEQLSWLNGAARFYAGYTPGHDIPYYYQNSLGGSFLLRGFTEDRFIDKGAWEFEIEQRISLFSTEIFGVVADWRIDPFVAVGQVYQDGDDIIRYARVSGGLGFRAFVHPNVLGRVDTAVGGDGIKVYVELGYPF